MKSKKLKGYLIEATLIIFSVLLALFLNASFEAYQTEKKKEIALTSILREIQRNQVILDTLYKRHNKVLAGITRLVNNPSDTLTNKLFGVNGMNLGVLTDNQNLMHELITSTSWETSRSTGIIAEFTYQEVKILTGVYALQQVILDKSFMKIYDLIFEGETHDKQNVKKTLIQFQLRFQELVGQEQILKTMYEQGIETLEKYNQH